MKLGMQIGYWGAGPLPETPDLVRIAEGLGYDSIWTAEAYGSDALTPLAWYGAATRDVKLGTSICQLSARSPAAMAMAAITLDHLSGGRMILGLGASGPQVVEGWYGDVYRKPLARTREYVELIRKIVARDARVVHDGEFYKMGLPGDSGLGKALRSTVHPLRPDIPIYLGAEGPKNVAMTAEIADGWLALFFSRKTDAEYRGQLAEGFARPGARRTADTFEVACTVPTIIHDDVEQAADAMRPFLALYVGGMGARDRNFHFDVFCRMGYEAEATKIQDLYLDGNKADAIAAVPTAMVEEICLIGPREKVRDELEAWKETCVTTLLVSGDATILRTMAELVL
ncbi:MAG: LLM class F420-dependent oxidoreductase [Acidimicrobiia bacterium]|nr:LLM class F420-dependent oxidoreductase [Acidimicrobiia bacterium]